MIKQIGSFIAKDSTGKTYHIYAFADFAESQSSSGFVSLPGIPYLKTSDGNHVQRIEKGRYKINGIPPIVLDIELTSDDPNAP